MIDIHSHLLPGVDDGSPSIEVSVRVLQRFSEQGVRKLVCTPHLDASYAADAPIEEHLALLEQLRAAAPKDIELLPGWEIMLDAPGTDLTAAGLSLGSSRAVLVEFTRGGLPPGSTTELRRIVRSGRVPVLAHPERYFGCTLEMVQQWRSIGTVIQTDAKVLVGRGAPSDFARQMLAYGFIDILASDNHGDERSLAVARDWLLEQGAEEQCELLTRHNAERLLENEDPIPVPPFAKSGLGNLIRRLFRS